MPGLPSLNKTLVITVKNYAKVFMEVLRYRPITLDSFTLFHIVLSAIVEEKKMGCFRFSLSVFSYHLTLMLKNIRVAESFKVQMSAK